MPFDEPWPQNLSCATYQEWLRSHIPCSGICARDEHAYRSHRDSTTDAGRCRRRPVSDIRLEALKANPEAFGSTFEIEDAQPLSWFAARLDSSELLGAFHDAKLVAIAGFAIQQGQKMAHKGTIWGMYVRPAARRTGIGRRLVEAIVDLARDRVELIQLAVVRDNEQARHLYASLGFREYGVEKNALKQDGRYYDEVLMAKNLLEKSS
jgi:ribosomal protein S18 acetylase RimI-like enzyme